MDDVSCTLFLNICISTFANYITKTVTLRTKTLQKQCLQKFVVYGNLFCTWIWWTGRRRRLRTHGWWMFNVRLQRFHQHWMDREYAHGDLLINELQDLKINCCRAATILRKYFFSQSYLSKENVMWAFGYFFQVRYSLTSLE